MVLIIVYLFNYDILLLLYIWVEWFYDIDKNVYWDLIYMFVFLFDGIEIYSGMGGLFVYI